MLCMRSEPSTASQSDDMTAFHFNPAKSTWTLLAAAVLWTTTNILSGIKATTGRNFPSFELPTQGQRPPACFDAFIAWHVLIVASIHKIARLTSWALTQVMHSISCDVGYAAFLAGTPNLPLAEPPPPLDGLPTPNHPVEAHTPLHSSLTHSHTGTDACQRLAHPRSARAAGHWQRAFWSDWTSPDAFCFVSLRS